MPASPQFAAAPPPLPPLHPGDGSHAKYAILPSPIFGSRPQSQETKRLTARKIMRATSPNYRPPLSPLLAISARAIACAGLQPRLSRRTNHLQGGPAVSCPRFPPFPVPLPAWSTMMKMRRVLAMLLAALFSFSLISPAVLASDAGSRLPACCRRGGQHGCAMSNESASSSGPTAQAARCRFFPPAKAVPPGRTMGLAGVSPATAAEFRSQPASCPLAESLYRISFSRACRPRGPPAPLS